MARELLVGLVQGLLFGMLLNALNLGFFGKMLLVLNAAISGVSAFLGIGAILLVNAACAVFTIKALKKNPSHTALGLVIGLAASAF